MIAALDALASLLGSHLALTEHTFRLNIFDADDVDPWSMAALSASATLGGGHYSFSSQAASKPGTGSAPVAASITTVTPDPRLAAIMGDFSSPTAPLAATAQHFGGGGDDDDDDDLLALMDLATAKKGNK